MKEPMEYMLTERPVAQIPGRIDVDTIKKLKALRRQKNCSWSVLLREIVETYFRVKRIKRP